MPCYRDMYSPTDSHLIALYQARGKTTVQVKSHLRQPKYLISYLISILTSFPQTLNRATELDTKSLRSLRRNRVVPSPLHKVHTVQTKGFDFHNGFTFGCNRLGDVSNVEVCGCAYAVFDISLLLGICLTNSWKDGTLPTARIVGLIFADCCQLAMGEVS